LQVEITRIDPSLPLPSYGTQGAAGFDLYSRVDATITPADIALLPTNLVIRVPDGYVLLVTLRSSTPRRKGLIMPNGVGVIDSDYCGPSDEIAIQVLNVGERTTTVERGERVAQGLLIPIHKCSWIEVDASHRSDRGGFGSTG
jgi:dUTP pyrophosphatase